MKTESMLGGNLEDIPAAARRAEDLGYDGVASGETTSDPMLRLTLAAEHTQRVTLGTSILIAFPRSPMVVAYQAWELQRFSKGRFLLGLGTQVAAHNIRRFSTPWPSGSGPRLREYVQSLRAIWDCWQTGKKLDFQGEHYKFNLMTPTFNPGPIEHPRIPIYIAGVNTYHCRLAGELCDGLRMHSFNTPRYAREVILPAVEEGLRKAGRSRKDLTITIPGFVVTGATRTEVERNKAPTKQRIAFYASTPDYRPVMDLHGWGETAIELHRLSREGKWVEMGELITDEMLGEFAAVGTYDEIAARQKAKWAGLADCIGFSVSARDGVNDERLRKMLQELKA